MTEDQEIPDAYEADAQQAADAAEPLNRDEINTLLDVMEHEAI